MKKQNIKPLKQSINGNIKPLKLNKTEESNNSKLFRLLPELQQIAVDMKKANEISEEEKDLITKKYRVEMEYDEGAYLVSAGNYTGTFDACDIGNDDVEDIPDDEIKNRIIKAGKAFVKNFNVFHNRLYAICEKREWYIVDEDECTFVISKDDLEIDIAGDIDDYKKYVVLSPVCEVEVGYIARHVIAIEEHKRQKNERRKTNSNMD